jgi:hypothetical protein
MYSGVENRAAQIRLIKSAAKATVTAEHFEVFSLLFSLVLKPAMTERDKMAHWTWGYSDELPDALLISEPEYTLESLMHVLEFFPGIESASVKQDFDRIFVVRDGDLDATIQRSTTAKNYLRLAMGTVWDHNPPLRRAEYLQQLSDVPPIREGLERLNARRKRNEATQPPIPPQEPSD